MNLHKNVSSARSLETRQRQIYTNAYKALAAQNAKYAEENETDYKAPTDEQIKAECQRRWQLNVERKKDKQDVSSFFEL